MRLLLLLTLIAATPTYAQPAEATQPRFDVHVPLLPKYRNIFMAETLKEHAFALGYNATAAAECGRITPTELASFEEEATKKLRKDRRRVRDLPFDMLDGQNAALDALEANPERVCTGLLDADLQAVRSMIGK